MKEKVNFKTILRIVGSLSRRLCGIALVAVIGFSMAACGDGGDKEDSGGTAAVAVPSDPFEPPVDPPAVTPTTKTITNDVATLGIIGTSTKSSNNKVATAGISDGNVVVTSVGKGVATITVIVDDTHKSDAEIEIRVDQDGTINQGRIVKGGDTVITISGTFGGVTIKGSQRPVRLTVQFEYDGSYQIVLAPGTQSWSIKYMPLTQDTPLWFQAYIPITGDSEYSIGTGITYQYDILRTVKDSDITDISIPQVTIPDLVTISGSAGATLKGTWNRDKKYVGVNVTNNNITTDLYDTKTIEQGWASASTRVENGQWTLNVPSSSTPTNVSFSVQLVSSQASDEWNYLGYWEMGQKNNLLNATTVSNQDKSGVDLGTIPFVMVSGNTPVKVNGTRPFSYWMEFGYYWDPDPTVEPNGWDGQSMVLYEATAWSVPMPANTKMNASIIYREKSRIQFRGGTDGVTFNTGNEPVTLNLSSISNISK